MKARDPSAGRWQRRPDAQRLRCADPAQLQRLHEAIEDAEAAWRSAWGMAAAPACSVHCCDAQVPGTGPDLEPLAWAPHAAAWIRWAHATEAQLFPGAPDTPLATAARAASRRDRAARLALALALEHGAVRGSAAAAPGGRWSGAARAVLACGSELRVDAGCLAALDTRPPKPVRAAKPVTSVSLAAARRCVRVQARLAGCTLDVGVLQALQPGDVVRLDHVLSAPLAVHGPDGALLFSGFLAARAGNKAVELAGAATSSHQTETSP